MAKKTAKNTAPEAPKKPRYEWPQNKEKRNLFVFLTDHELEAAGRQLAATVPEIAELEQSAKASAAGWKSKIQAVEVEQKRLSNIVTHKREERSVDCEWVFECAGVDSDKKRIEHSEKKTLFRKDTGEVVEIRDITASDRQGSLRLDDDTDADKGKNGGK